MDYLASVCYQDEATSAINAFNNAIGTDGYSYKAYESNQDSRMKSACESVKERFSNVNSTYMKFDLYRNTLSADPQAQKSQDIIGTYVMGQALSKPFVTYSISSNEDDAYAALEALKNTLDERVYTVSRRTLGTLLGRHITTGSSSFTSQSVFDRQFANTFSKVWEDSQVNDNYIAHVCDSIAGAHASDTLAVQAIVTISKTGFLNKEVTQIWTRTFDANAE